MADKTLYDCPHCEYPLTSFKGNRCPGCGAFFRIIFYDPTKVGWSKWCKRSDGSVIEPEHIKVIETKEEVSDG